jgi:uncharacterized membrane protein (DUF106 family)
MNPFMYNSFIILLIIVIFSCAFTKKDEIYQESFFVPKKVKEFYRPIHRNIRMSYEGFYDKSSTQISNLFKKFGIL